MLTDGFQERVPVPDSSVTLLDDLLAELTDAVHNVAAARAIMVGLGGMGFPAPGARPGPVWVTT